MNENTPKINPKELQDYFQQYITEKRFHELSKLIETWDTKPPEYMVRMGYKTYMEETQGRKVKLFYIMKLKEITGIKPDKQVIKEACEISLKMDSPEILESLVKRVEIEADFFREIQPSIQKTYTDYVAEGKFIDISTLTELTGIKPEEKIIHKGYESYLEEGKFISFAGLKKRTGIKPDPVMIQFIYKKYHFNYLKCQKSSSGDQANDWMDYIRKLKRLSRIEPDGITIPEEETSPPEDIE